MRTKSTVSIEPHLAEGVAETLQKTGIGGEFEVYWT
jgi:hypothetical protein